MRKKSLLQNIEAFKEFKVSESENIIFFKAEDEINLAEKLNELPKEYTFLKFKDRYSLEKFSENYKAFFSDDIF